MVETGPWRRFAGDERASVTIEFMLWLPLLLLWFVASVVIYDAYRTRDTALKASIIGTDFVSRKVILNNADLDSIYSLMQGILQQVDGTVRFRVSSIEFEEGKSGDPAALDADDVYCLDWSRGRPDSGERKFEPFGSDNSQIPREIYDQLPIIADEYSVLLVELEVPFIPFSDWVGIEAQTWSYDQFVKPRSGVNVEFSGVPDQDCKSS
jgi:hypothetical protein